MNALDPLMIEQLKARRGLVVGVVVALLCLAGAFSAGRFSSPAVVATAISVQVARVETVKVVERIVTVKEAAKTTILWRDRVIAKDGTVTEHVVEKTASDSKVSVSDNTDRTATLSEQSNSVSTKTVTNLPRWRISLGVGASLTNPLVPIAGPLVIVTSGEYRVIGGLSLGIWLNTGGSAGILASFAF